METAANLQTEGSIASLQANMGEYMAQFSAMNEQLLKQQEALAELQRGISMMLESRTQSMSSLNSTGKGPAIAHPEQTSFHVLPVPSAILAPLKSGGSPLKNSNIINRGANTI